MHSIVFQVFISTWLQKRNRLQCQRGREGGQRRRNRESRRDWRAWQPSHTTSPHRYPSANFKKVDVVFEWNYGWILVHIGPSPNKVKFNATVSDHWWPLYRVPFDSSSDNKYVTLWKNVTDCPDLQMFRFNFHGPTNRTLVVMRHLKEQSLTPASADIVNVDDGYGWWIYANCK